MGFSSNSSKSNQQSTQSSESKNQAYPFLQDQLGGEVSGVAGTNNAIRNLLGLNGKVGVDEGFSTFKNSAGYDFIKDEGIKGITSNNATKGLLNSGSTLKAVSGFSSNLANNFLEKYLSSLFNLSGSGLQAGSILSSAGNTANSQGNSSGSSTGSGFGFNLK